jgi:hypothetical protein
VNGHDCGGLSLGYAGEGEKRRKAPKREEKVAGFILTELGLEGDRKRQTRGGDIGEDPASVSRGGEFT